MAVPVEPVLFMKATSAICGPDDDVVIPRGSKKSDWEVELGVVDDSLRLEGREVGQLFKRADEFRPAIRVAAVIDCVRPYENIGRSEHLGPGEGRAGT